MNLLMRLLRLLLKAAIFFVLFAFALNNQHEITVNFFFGTHWRGPLVLVVLAVFAAGVVFGAIAMAPRWWRRRRSRRKPANTVAATGAAALPPPVPSATPALYEPPPAVAPSHGP